MPQKLFKTGEFAKLCHTTKDTLFYYDRIGLLQPTQILPNGYRLYNFNQTYLFDLITIFKELGMSLEEIQRYIKKRNTENFIRLLQEKNKQLDKELALLKRRKSLLQNTLQLAKSSRNVQENTITFKDCSKNYYILSEEVNANTTEEESFAIWSKLIAYCEKHKYFDAFITGTIISAANVAAKSFNTFHFTSHLDKPVSSKFLHIRPEGRYACKYVRCSYNAIAKECAKFYNELQAQKIITTGAIYQSNISSYLTEVNSEDYLILLKIKVE